MMKIVLNVAEKPSIARQVSKILGKPKRVHGLSQFNPVYEFELNRTLMRFTSVRGHVQTIRFEKNLRNWNSYDPRSLFYEKIVKEVIVGNQNIVQNLGQLSKDAQDLVLWLDCDMEGEAIAKEVEEICLKYNPHLTVRRARFSSLAHKQIYHALNHLDVIKQLDVNAVRYRQQLDFRVGCAMTNIQSLILRRGEAETNRTINFGNCMIPLLNLVVQRFTQRSSFVTEKYWEINVTYCDPTTKIKYEFTWDEDFGLLQNSQAKREAQTIKEATVVKVETEKVFKRRPLPLNTTTMLKHCTRAFKMESLKVMQVAQRLYQQGFISYPRTETNRYPEGVDLTQIVKKFGTDDRFREKALMVLKNQVIEGRSGKEDDQAHAPIYPLEVKTTFQRTYEESVYTYIVNNFLTSVSLDAQIEQHRVRIQTPNGYHFCRKGSKVIERGFMEVEGTKHKEQPILDLAQGQTIAISKAKVKQIQTQPPPALTEAHLIQLMEDNKIGTDATIPQHINNIQLKNYALKKQSVFVPTKIGLALIRSYQHIGSAFSDPRLRADMENTVRLISQNKQGYQESYQKTLDSFIAAYDHFVANKDKFLEMFGQLINLDLHQEQDREIEQLKCYKCQSQMRLTGRSLVCNQCSIKYSLPKQGAISLLKHTSCFKCSSMLLSVTKQSSTYKICPRCFNYPEPHMMLKEDQEKLPCFTCQLSQCAHSATFKLCRCPQCDNGWLKVTKSKKQSMFIGCSTYPECKALVTFSSYVSKVQASQSICESCTTESHKVHKCRLTVGTNNNTVEVCVNPPCKVKRHYVKLRDN